MLKEAGSTATEYALVAALISGVIIASLNALETGIANMFVTVQNAILL